MNVIRFQTRTLFLQELNNLKPSERNFWGFFCWFRYIKLMKIKKPKNLKFKSRLIKLFTKTLIKPIDNYFNTTVEEKILRNFLNTHQQNYNLVYNKIYFIHVPKTGGTSFYLELLRKYKNKLYKPYYPSNYNIHYPLKKKPNFNNAQTITIVRDPIERVYSYFHDVLKNRKNIYFSIAKRGLENFCKKAWEAQNLYCRYYSGNLNSDFKKNIVLAKNHLRYFDKIILFENLHKTLSVHKNKKGYPSMMECDQKIIKTYNEYDLEIYEFIKKNLVKNN